MRSILTLIVVAALAGCNSLNSPAAPDRRSSDQKKPCSCEGMEQCGTGRNGTPCCSPDDCCCKQVSTK